jgi:2-dehydropantoate 2-reductase
VIVTTKSRDTAAAALSIPAGVPVVASLQNGVRNGAAIRAALPGRTVWPGMVPFNVVWTDDGRLHQGTSGPVVLPPEAEAVVAALRAGGCDARTHVDVAAVQWGKLLLNLNNAVNALAGVPLREQLSDRGWRLLLADVIDEGRRVLRAAGVRAQGVGLLRPGLAPTALRLPDLLFFRVAGAMIRIDPEARSSTQDDLARGRPTEVDELNGEIARLGEAPLNAGLVRLVRAAEGHGSPRMSAAALRAALTG